ncbi:AAA family ATPase [Streptomyces sp. NPDC087212]|uniref:AAA family ATPase n=1 Tax=Streptomyces sp. NPDC087212 TaxID=3365766 RepID=UPI00381C3F41
MYGREAELSAVDEVHGRPLLLLLRGRPGIGRTTLLREVHRTWRTRTSGVIRLHCSDTAPRWDLFGTKATLKAFRNGVDDAADSPAPDALATVTRLCRPESYGSHRARSVLFTELVGLLAQLNGSTPGAVLIDDVHTAPDPALMVAAAQRAGCTVVATCPEEGWAPGPRRSPGLRGIADRVVDLGPLPDHRIDELLASAAPDPLDEAVAPALRTALGSWSGNPGTVLNTFESWRQEGQLTSFQGYLCLSDPTAVPPLPADHTLVRRAAECGAPAGQLLALTASVGHFALDDLPDFAQATGRALADCGHTLDNLVAAGALTCDDHGILTVPCPALIPALLSTPAQGKAVQVAPAQASAPRQEPTTHRPAQPERTTHRSPQPEPPTHQTPRPERAAHQPPRPERAAPEPTRREPAAARTVRHETAEIHRALAEHLLRKGELTPPTSPIPPDPTTLADHIAHAGPALPPTPAVVPLLEQAATRTLATRPDRAARWYRAALHHCEPDAPAHARILTALLPLLVRVGDHEGLAETVAVAATRSPRNEVRPAPTEFGLTPHTGAPGSTDAPDHPDGTDGTDGTGHLSHPDGTNEPGDLSYPGHPDDPSHLSPADAPDAPDAPGDLAAYATLAALHTGRPIPAPVHRTLAETSPFSNALDLEASWFTSQAPLDPTKTRTAFASLLPNAPTAPTSPTDQATPTGPPPTSTTTATPTDPPPTSTTSTTPLDLLRQTLTPALYTAPATGPLAVHARVLRSHREGDWARIPAEARALELAGLPRTPVHQAVRLIAVEVHSALGDYERAAGWLELAGEDGPFPTLYSWAAMGLAYRTGAWERCRELGWTHCERAAQLPDATSTLGLDWFLVRLAFAEWGESGSRAGLPRLRTEAERWYERVGGPGLHAASLIIRALAERDVSTAQLAVDILREQGASGELLPACLAMAFLADDPHPWHREVREIARSLGEGLHRAPFTKSSGPPVPAPADPVTLSGLEGRITVLVGRGLTNRQLARELQVSQKTVENNLTQVFAKTGCRSRLDLALAALEGRLGALLTRSVGS